ncbi:MAG TPA: thiamine phosphate synthase [Candidatus Dormibacteraeota bacterium]|nr:thiamine phosphate synthase [Candidatus Dormibacteraeota bacterium]
MAIVADAKSGLRAAPRASVLQLRAPQLDARRLEREATDLVASVDLPVLVSSRCDVALAAGAAGVNLPERDISTHDARALIGHGLVGRSVHSVEAAQRAQVEGADFVIFGPVWESASHPGARPAGLEALRRIAGAVRIPVLAVGGVTEERVGQCLAAGAAGYAAISMFR